MRAAALARSAVSSTPVTEYDEQTEVEEVWDGAKWITVRKQTTVYETTRSGQGRGLLQHVRCSTTPPPPYSAAQYSSLTLMLLMANLANTKWCK